MSDSLSKYGKDSSMQGYTSKEGFGKFSLLYTANKLIKFARRFTINMLHN